MTDPADAGADTPGAGPPPAPPTKRRPWWRWIIAFVLMPLLTGAVLLALVDTDIGHRFLADRIGAIRPANGLRYSVGRINGSVFSRATLIDVRISDPRGVVFTAPRASLAWSPLGALSNRLDIDSLTIPVAHLERLPQTIKTGRRGPILPGFDIHVGTLDVRRLYLSAAVAGKPRLARLHAAADVRQGRAMVNLNAVVAGSDSVRVTLDAAPDQDRFDLSAMARGERDGVLATLSGLGKPIAIDLDGAGRWQQWRGTARAQVAGDRVVDLALGNKAGAFTLDGAATVAAITTGKVQRLAGPRTLIHGAATLANRVLDGTLSLRSRALDLGATGKLDLGASAFRDVRITGRLLTPPALFPNMTGRGIELRAILDGGFATAAFDYRLTADRVAFDATGFEMVKAAGQGRLSASPVLVPLSVTAARVTGAGEVAGGILRNLALTGVLQITPTLVIGNALKFRSDKLSGTATLRLDLRTGLYDVALNGALGRYLIPGLGIVDVTSRLQVVPVPGGKGTRIIGTGTAQMLRLDNSFLASLSGGLPRITTAIERTADGVLHFSNLVLTAPAIRIAGTGIRRKDGTFHFEGGGNQRSYGPLTLKLDGKIDRPTLDLVFAHPNAAMGLANVRAHLDPDASGYRFTASGGSRLGDFTGNGQILLPRGGTATVAIAALDVGGIKAHGELRAVTGGFDGTLQVAGSGVTGTVAFAPANGVQRIEAHLDARNATLLGDATLRRGRLDLVMLLDPDAASIEASGRAAGLRRGSLGLGRLTASASLRGGVGKVQWMIAGSRGRAFDISGTADVTPNRYVIDAAGTIDRRAIKLLSPAIVTTTDDGVELAPTRISFSGGSAEIGGKFGAQSMAIDAKLAQLPLSVIDIAYPGLGLSGAASGTLRYSQAPATAPTGRVDMTIRGISRSGLVLTSQPVDLGLAGVLGGNNAALRVIMASNGKTIGRAQARLSPLGSGTLRQRLANADLFAQVRYNGPADTLWRLTGIELFDLSGPVAIGADLSGRVNDPRIRGVLRASGARIESAATGTVLTNVQAAGAFSGSKLAVTSFAADAGRGGRVTGTGSFDFAAVNGFGIDLSLQASNAVMIDRDDIGATVTGPIAIKSDGSGGVISGRLALDAARYRLGQAEAATALPRLNVREINVVGSDEEIDDAPLKPWRLDLSVKGDRGLSVTGLGLTSEWSTDLRITGAPDDPVINGRADLVRGLYEFSGREFTLERGVIRFAGEVPANPVLDIAANADATGLSASIRVTGAAAKPEISFTSTPALPQDELLSRLLFGTSITKLSAPEALQLAAAVASLNSSGGGLNPINALRRVAGLDRLRILPADTVVGRTTSVAAGKYITRRLYAEIITDGAGYSATQIEFQVTRWLSILSTISTIGRQSANVRVSKDY